MLFINNTCLYSSTYGSNVNNGAEDSIHFHTFCMNVEHIIIVLNLHITSVLCLHKMFLYFWVSPSTRVGTFFLFLIIVTG